MNSRLLRSLHPILLVAVLTGCAAHASYADFYGIAAEPAAAIRTIEITPDTRYVNVEGGETVRFVSGDKEFAWHFLVASAISSFRLDRVAPAGILDQPVEAFVSPDPRYIGGGGPDS